MTTTNVRETSRVVAIAEMLVAAYERQLVAAYERREDRMHHAIDRLRQVRADFLMRALPLATAVCKLLGVYKETNDSRSARMACLFESLRLDQMSELQRVLTPEQFLHLTDLYQDLMPPPPPPQARPDPSPSTAH